jgi:hypothetical protein
MRTDIIHVVVLALMCVLIHGFWEIEHSSAMGMSECRCCQGLLMLMPSVEIDGQYATILVGSAIIGHYCTPCVNVLEKVAEG